MDSFTEGLDLGCKVSGCGINYS